MSWAPADLTHMFWTCSHTATLNMCLKPLAGDGGETLHLVSSAWSTTTSKNWIKEYYSMQCYCYTAYPRRAPADLWWWGGGEGTHPGCHNSGTHFPCRTFPLTWPCLTLLAKPRPLINTIHLWTQLLLTSSIYTSYFLSFNSCNSSSMCSFSL